jgi:hypothetical protein
LYQQEERMSLLRTANVDLRTRSRIEQNETNVDSGSGTGSPSQPRVERRREHRYAACEIVEVQVIGASGGRFGGIILDISRSGLKIEIGKPLSQGAHLEILLPGRAIIMGEARYCRSKNKLYQVGVKIEGVYFSHAVSSRHVGKELMARYKSLPPLAAMEVANHLASCEACRALAEIAQESPVS